MRGPVALSPEFLISLAMLIDLWPLQIQVGRRRRPAGAMVLQASRYNAFSRWPVVMGMRCA